MLIGRFTFVGGVSDADYGILAVSVLQREIGVGDASYSRSRSIGPRKHRPALALPAGEEALAGTVVAQQGL